MTCKRVNCAECVTRLVLKNNVQGVEHYLNNLDRSLPMNIYITIPFASLQRPLIEHHNQYKEGVEMAEYILKKPGDHEHLSFEALIAGDNEYWSYAVYPFYALIVRCDWVNSEVVRMILKSGIIDPLENHINVVYWERKLSDNGADYNLHPRNVIKSMNVLTQLIISPFRNHIMDIITEANINNSFPKPNRFNVDIGVVQRAMKRPESGLWGNAEHMWPLRDHSLAPAMQSEGKSIFMLLFRSHWLTSNQETDICLTNFRHNLLKPMIRFGLDVNVHATDIYKWYPMRISHILNVMGELIRHGLMNFHSPSPASIPVILICYAANNELCDNFLRRFRKVCQILEMLHRLGWSWQLNKSHLEFEERALKKFQTRDIADTLIYPLSDSLRRFQYQSDWRDWDKMKRALEYVRALRRQPLPLTDLSRISIRRALGGRHFKQSVRALPLPLKMKEFVRANIMPELLAKYGI